MWDWLLNLLGFGGEDKNGYNKGLIKELEKEHEQLIAQINKILGMMDVLNEYMVKKHIDELKVELLSYFMKDEFKFVKYLTDHYKEDAPTFDTIKKHEEEMKDMKKDIISLLDRSMGEDAIFPDKVTKHLNSVIFIMNSRMDLQRKELFDLYKK
jgi:Asp-tRNA(Asn)/Glu-tRNA(Gln) amidotransferase C subunit